MSFRVFMSHSTADLGLVYQLKYWLEANGIEVYIAQLSLQPGVSLAQKVTTAIEECDCFVALLTADGSRSEWVREEIGIAYRTGRVIVPIVEKGIQVKGLLEGKEYITFDALNPALAIDHAVRYLSGLKLGKENNQRATATVLLVLGMLAVAALASQQRTGIAR